MRGKAQHSLVLVALLLSLTACTVAATNSGPLETLFCLVSRIENLALPQPSLWWLPACKPLGTQTRPESIDHVKTISNLAVGALGDTNQDSFGMFYVQPSL
mmetsp:Transcript_7028/g.14097  ORF Transcript_7028/g.14097 Transcript_7028/m.14097 type:complete len:101 (-) Transcript_7028:154-456(-)